MNFHIFKEAVQKQFDEISSHNLFLTDVDKNVLWDFYLESFPPGTNSIFKERREYDCQCCKQFIRTCGNLVAIIDNKLVSIWDIRVDGYYQVVANHMSNLVKCEPIRDVFYHYENHVGTDFNHQQAKEEGGSIKKWEHFYLDLPQKVVKEKQDIPTMLSGLRSAKDVFKRGLEEITIESVETVLELIDQSSL